jgi:hypothetical protein
MTINPGSLGEYAHAHENLMWDDHSPEKKPQKKQLSKRQTGGCQQTQHVENLSVRFPRDSLHLLIGDIVL